MHQDARCKSSTDFRRIACFRGRPFLVLKYANALRGCAAHGPWRFSVFQLQVFSFISPIAFYDSIYMCTVGRSSTDPKNMGSR